MIVVLLFALMQMTLAFGPFMRGQDLPIVTFDGDYGVLVELPPESASFDVTENGLPMDALFSMISPVLESITGQGIGKYKGTMKETKVEGKTKTVEKIIKNLYKVLSKLEKRQNINSDIDKAMDDLQKLRMTTRPNTEQSFSSPSTSFVKPIPMPNLRDVFSTKNSDTYEKSSIFEIPETNDNGISVKMMYGVKSIVKKVPADDIVSVTVDSGEKQTDGITGVIDKPDVEKSSEENYNATKAPSEVWPYKTRSKDMVVTKEKMVDSEDVYPIMSKYGWK